LPVTIGHRLESAKINSDAGPNPSNLAVRFALIVVSTPALSQPSSTPECNPDAARTRTFTEWEDRIASAVLMQGILSDPQRRTERTGELLEQISLQTVNDRLAWMLGAPDQVMLYQFPGAQRAIAPDLAVLSAQRERLAQLTELPPLPMPDKPLPAAMPAAIPDWPQKGAALPSGGVISVAQEPHSTVTKWRPPNGDRFVWLDHQTPASKIYLSGRSSVGYRNQQFGSLLSQAALQLWTQSGFGFWSQAEYDRWQEKQTQTWSWALHAGHLDVGAVVEPQHLPDLMRNYAATVEHGLVRDAAVPAFAESRANLSARTDAFSDLVYGPDTDEQDDTQAVTGERLEAAAQALLRQPVTWFAVGPKPDDAALDKVFAMAGGLDRRAVLTASAPQQESDIKWQNLHTKGDDRAQVRISFSSRHDWTPEAGFILSTFNQPTQQALKAELRHRLSGVYSVNFDLKLDKDTDRVVGELSFSCAPQRANELSHAALDTLKRMPEILGDADIAALRKDIADAEQQRKSDPATLLRRLALSYERYGDAGYLRRVQALGDKLTADGMRRHARHVFDLTNLVVLIETPE
jgi:zinc protease